MTFAFSREEMEGKRVKGRDQNPSPLSSLFPRLGALEEA
jgi:hypothetical protein